MRAIASSVGVGGNSVSIHFWIVLCLVSILFSLISPLRADAAGIVTCGKGSFTQMVDTSTGQICYARGGENAECTFCDITTMAQSIINFIVDAVVWIAAILFVNAGVLYVGASANASNVGRAHRMFTNALIGLVITLAAWLLIDVVMKTLVSESADVNGRALGPWNDIICKDALIAPYCFTPNGGLNFSDPGLSIPPTIIRPGVVTGNTICPVASDGTGCSPSELSSIFGQYAEHASSICYAETSGNNIPSGCDVCTNTGDPFSFGYFQINIRANYVIDAGGNKLNCPSAFTNYKNNGGCNYTCDIVDRDLYDACRSAIMTPSVNFSNALRISGGGSNWAPWSTARFGPSCGVIPK